MSVVDETKDAILLGKIPSRIALYEQMIDEAEPLFSLDDMNLEEACKVHAQNIMNYNVMLQECKTIEDTIKLKVEEIESQVYKKLNEGMQIKLSPTDIKNYMKGDPAYIKAMEMLLEVQYTKTRLDAVVDAFRSMGWMINNITKIRIAQLEEVAL